MSNSSGDLEPAGRSALWRSGLSLSRHYLLVARVEDVILQFALLGGQQRPGVPGARRQREDGRRSVAR